MHFPPSALTPTVKPQALFRENSVLSPQRQELVLDTPTVHKMEMTTVQRSCPQDEDSAMQTRFQKSPQGPEAERITLRPARKKVCRCMSGEDSA